MSPEEMMVLKTINCPTCGASLEIRSAYSKSVVCSYCSQTVLIKDYGLDVTGKLAKIVDAPGRFAVGRSGAIRGKKFRVLGRIRYRYDGGFWDEWYIQFDDRTTGWVTEEEGACVLFHREALVSALDGLDGIRVGRTLRVNDQPVFVTEVSDVDIGGGEGELHFSFDPGESIRHIDGNCKGKLVSIEISKDEIECHFGESLKPEDVKIVAKS